MGLEICIVLAGGMGTRLRSAVPDLPKCLAPIAGHSFLELQLRSLARRGVKRFLLALGYGADQVIDAIAQPWANNLAIDYVIEDSALGTGGATRFAMLQSNCDEALIINGDTFLGGTLDEMFRPLNIAGGELMRMATVQVLDRSRFGGVKSDTSNYAIDFLEKGQAGSGHINAGLYRINLRAFAGESQNKFSLETSVMPRLLHQRALRVCELTGPFIDIGIPEDYQFFNKEYRGYVDQ